MDEKELRTTLARLKRQEALLEKHAEKRKDLEGTLHVAHNKNHFDYFRYVGNSRYENEGKVEEILERSVTDLQEGTNTVRKTFYIPKNQIDIAKNLAQTEYENKTLKEIRKQIKTIEHFMKNYQEFAVREVYKHLHPGKKVLVRPIEDSDEEFVKKWLESGNDFDRKQIHRADPILTEQGEYVRSKSEEIIANKLFMEGIPYIYEKPLQLKQYGTIHPDFTVLNVRTRKVYYWEHCGMMDDTSYYTDFVDRTNAYIKNGILSGEQLILTFERKNGNPDKMILDRMISTYLR